MSAARKDNEASASDISENRTVENEVRPEEQPVGPEALQTPHEDLAIGPEEDDVILEPEIPETPEVTRTQEAKETPQTYMELKRLKQENALLQDQIKNERDPEKLIELRSKLVENLTAMNDIILAEKTRIQNSKLNRQYGLVLISLAKNELIKPSDLGDARKNNTPILFRVRDESLAHKYRVGKTDDTDLETVVGTNVARRSEFYMYSEIKPGKWGITHFDLAPKNENDKLKKGIDKQGLHNLKFPPYDHIRQAKKTLSNNAIKRHHGSVFNILEKNNPYLRDKPDPQEVWIMQEQAQLKKMSDDSNKLLSDNQYKVQETVSEAKKSEILAAERQYVGGPRGDHFSATPPPPLSRSGTLKSLADPVIDAYRRLRSGTSSKKLLSEANSPAENKEKQKKSGPS